MTTTQSTVLLIHTKTFRAHLWQRFRYTPSGREYVLTQTKRGKTTVWVPATCKVLGPGAVAEQWRKADSDESAAAINDIAAWHSKAPEYLQFFRMPRFTSEQERSGERCTLTGPVTLRVVWASGRTTEHTAQSWRVAYDVISGECQPFERWEMTAR